MKTANFLKMMMLFLAIGITSCSTNSTDDGTSGGNGSGGSSGVTLEASKSRVYDNTIVSFTVRDSNGAIATSSAVITVDGTPITGTTTLLTGVGTKAVQATLGTETSNTVNIDVITPSYTTKGLIEDYTGAGCGWCPRVSQGILDVHAASNGENVYAVAIHNPVFGPDPMTFAQRSVLENHFGINGYPSAVLNRDQEWNAASNHNMNVQQALSMLNSTAQVGLAIDSNVSGSTVNATIKVGFDLDQSGLKLVAFLLENGIVYPQTNYTNNWGGVSPITNFEHNDVLRTSFTDLFGDAIPADQQVGGTEYTATLSATSSGVNTTDWDIIAFVVDASGNVVNVQKAAVGTNKDFD